LRVFVLGAGASYHAGYPLAAEMGKRLAAWIGTLPSGHDYHVYLGQIAEAYGGLDDFEAVLADLMTCPPGSPALALPPAFLPPLLTNLKEAIRDYFDSIRSGSPILYDKLAEIIRPGDSVITFNYDLAVEHALHTAGLWYIETGYGFPIDDRKPSPVEVLKLHGSTNWRALLFGGRARGSFHANGISLGDRPVLFFRPDLEYLGYHGFVDPLCAHLDQRTRACPAMILPAVPKRFCFETSFGEEWKPVLGRPVAACPKRAVDRSRRARDNRVQHANHR
jgi:hypothetical protein